MADNLNQQLEQTVAGLSKNTPIEAGQTGSNLEVDSEESQRRKYEQIDAISQLFAEFELVFHNQYTKAFSTPEKLNFGKKLWFTHLRGFSPETILAAGSRAIKDSTFLPTVHTLLKYCEESLTEIGLPLPYQAYVEACNAPQPKIAASWSHPAVYYAGKASDWYFLANNPEAAALPMFEQHYRQFCTMVQQGKELIIDRPEQLPNKEKPTLSREESAKRMAELRAQTGL